MLSPHWHKTPSGKLRARGLKLPLPGIPGPFNAITDVEGVAIGYANIVEGEGPLISGEGPVRTGVTAILPRPLPTNPAPLCSRILNTERQWRNDRSNLD